MARVFKKFNTESEYEAWVNGPYMRTPYTCWVTSTGKVHYFNGDDNDYSITAVIRKTGWVKIGSASMMDHITEIYRNGVLEIAGPSNPWFAKGCEGPHYYHSKQDYGILNDYKDVPQTYGDIEERGGYLPNNFYQLEGARPVLTYFPRRFAKTHGRAMTEEDYGYWGKCLQEYRFLYVRKGDIIKFVFDGDVHYAERGIELPMFMGFPNQPHMGNLHLFAKEIIFGDGWTGTIGKGMPLRQCHHVFLGKNIERFSSETNWSHTNYLHRIYARKSTDTSDFDDFGGAIKKI